MKRTRYITFLCLLALLLCACTDATETITDTEQETTLSSENQISENETDTVSENVSENEMREEDFTEEDIVYPYMEIEPITENNIYHPPYFIYELSAEEEAFLDNIIDTLESGAGEEFVKELDFDEVAAFIEDANTLQTGNMDRMNLVYRDYKIEIAAEEPYYLYPDGTSTPTTTKEINISIIPLSTGKGYGINSIWRQDRENEMNTEREYGYLESECNESMYDGYFSAILVRLYVDDDVERYFSETRCSGRSSMSLLDGDITYDEISRHWGMESKYGYVEHYNSGIIQPVKEENGEYGQGYIISESLYGNWGGGFIPAEMVNNLNFVTECCGRSSIGCSPDGIYYCSY